MRLWLGLTAGILGIIGAAVWWRFAAAIRIHRARVTRGSQVVSSRFGQIEFATVGHGAPVLVAHGGGGGFDQVISAAGRLIAAGHQVIAPSRFGFLRSASPDDPSPANQADAFAALLDALRIQSLPMVGISVGYAIGTAVCRAPSRSMPFVDGGRSGGFCRPVCPGTAPRSRLDGEGDR